MPFKFETKSLAHTKSQFDPAFDSARGWACFFVFLYHSDLVQGSAYKPEFLKAAWTSLAIFFVFSAYILFSTTASQGVMSWQKAKSFYIARCFRILPTWWFFLLFASQFYDVELKHIWTNAALIFGFGFWDSRYNFTIVGWSLFVEMLFYLIFPILVLSIISLKRASYGFVVAFVVFVLWRLWASAHPLPNHPHWYNQFPLNFPHIFLLGICIYYFLKNEQTALLQRPKIVRSLDAILIVTLFTLPMTLLYFVPVGLFLLLLKTPNSLVRLFLLSRFSQPMRSVGVICLSFYLFHTLVFGWTGKLMPFLYDYMVLKLCVDFSFTWLIAKLVYEFLERPTHQLGYRLANKMNRAVQKSLGA